jgi:hypothetical protein
MEKTYYKPALALLYLLQLMIVFRESVAEAYKHAVEAINGKVELVDTDVTKSIVAQEGRREPSEEPTLVIEHSATALGAFVLTGHVMDSARDHDALRHDNHSHPETEDDTKKMRRKRWREILLANLFPSFQRFAEPARSMNAPAFTPLRPVSFPAA